MKIANIEAEFDVLAAILFEPSYFDALYKILQTEMAFYEPHNRLIFKAMIKLNEKNITIDIINLYEILKDQIEIKHITHLQTFRLADPFTSAKVVYENFMKRRLIETFEDVRKKIITADAFEIVENTAQNIERISEDVKVQKDFEISDNIEKIFDLIMKERNSETQSVITSKDFPNFNHATEGIKGGNLVVISGDYKKGKSTFGLALLLDFVINSNITSAYFSLEMTNEEVIKKIISLTAGIRYGYWRNPKQKSNNEYLLNDERLKEMFVLMQRKFENKKLFVSDDIYDLTQLGIKVKQYVKKQKCKVILIDYIGLIETKDKFERRDLEVAYISRYFKILAKKLDVIIILLSQENSEGKVAESKALTRDADYWFSIVHPMDDVKKNKLEITQDFIYNGKKVTVKLDESLFLVELKASRHSVNGTRIFCQFHRNGKFTEIDPERKLSEQEYEIVNEVF